MLALRRAKLSRLASQSTLTARRTAWIPRPTGIKKRPPKPLLILRQMRRRTLTIFATKIISNNMRKIERLLLTFCYLFTLVAVVRMCMALVSGLELTFGNVVQVLFLFGALGFLFFMAGFMLLTKRP